MQDRLMKKSLQTPFILLKNIDFLNGSKELTYKKSYHKVNVTEYHESPLILVRGLISSEGL